MLWSKRRGRVSSASVRCSATGGGSFIAAIASRTALPPSPTGTARAKNGQRAIAARAAATSAAPSVPGPGSMHSSSGSERRCEKRRS